MARHNVTYEESQVQLSEAAAAVHAVNAEIASAEALTPELKTKMETTTAEWQEASRIHSHLRAVNNANLDTSEDPSTINTLIEMGRQASAPEAYVSAVAEYTQARLGQHETVAAVSAHEILRSHVSEEYRARAALDRSTATSGAELVPEELADSILDIQEHRGGVLPELRALTTNTGNVINIPKSDGNNEEGEWLAPGATASDEDPSFSEVTSEVHRLGSKVITVNRELLEDSPYNIAMFVLGRARFRMLNLRSRTFTVGSGANRPTGILENIVSARTTATVGEIGYQDLMHLKFSPDTSYRGAASWMMNDTSLLEISLLSDTQGRPLFLPAFDLADRGSTPSRLLSHRVVDNTYMPDPDTGNKAVGFGDWSTAISRRTSALYVQVFTDSAYSKQNRVGYLIETRAGLVETNRNSYRCLTVG